MLISVILNSLAPGQIAGVFEETFATSEHWNSTITTELQMSKTTNGKEVKVLISEIC
jgi:hypothetical protein